MQAKTSFRSAAVLSVVRASHLCARKGGTYRRTKRSAAPPRMHKHQRPDRRGNLPEPRDRCRVGGIRPYQPAQNDLTDALAEGGGLEREAVGSGYSRFAPSGTGWAIPIRLPSLS
jgi:hypothetical protein